MKVYEKHADGSKTVYMWPLFLSLIILTVFVAVTWRVVSVLWDVIV